MNIVITGASRGIGRAIALEFAKDGNNHFYLGHKDYNNMASFHSVCEECSNQSNKVTTMLLDVTNRIWINKLIKNLNVNEPLKIDYLINNAGIMKNKTLKNMSDEEWDSVLDTNITGMFNVTKAFLPYIQNGGAIVNITSFIGITGGYGQTNYSASKAAVIGFSKSLAKEVAKDNIRVNVVSCGLVDTEMSRSIPEKYLNEIINRTAFKRMATPEEIGKYVKYICKEAVYQTNSVISIDGGLT